MLSRDLADGVFITGCRKGECYQRFGQRWTEDRLARKRDPYLRARVPRERIGTFWAGPTDRRRLAQAVESFAARLGAPPPAPGGPERPAGTPEASAEEATVHG